MNLQNKSPQFADTMEGEGSYFRNQSLKIKENLSNEAYKNFCNINNNEERIKFIYNLESVQKIEVPKAPANKSGENALKNKNIGNQFFGKENYEAAIKFYSAAIMECPKSEDVLYSTLYANRSAAYYFVQQYNNALDDIEQCLHLPYPENLRYKVLERKARCYLALNELKPAIDSFKAAMPALEKSNLEVPNRLKKESDFAVMVALLSKTLKDGAPKKKSDNSKVSLPQVPKMKAKNENFPSASSSVKVENKMEEGRFAVANCDVEPGDVLVVENAHCANLLYEYAKTHCQNCFIRVWYFLPCENCTNVVFCSMSCKKVAMSTYHKYECGILGSLWSHGTSIICSLSLRIITQKGLEYFLKIKPTLFKDDFTKVYNPNCYKTVFNLCSHKDKRSHLDYFQRAVMAVIMLKYLQEAGYFPEKRAQNLHENEIYIGGLLLHNLEVLQFNAHEIAELQYDAGNPGDLEKAKSQFIGGGLFPTLALFNHSCEPGIVRYFSGSKVVVRAVKPILSGEIIAENYGPIYTQTPKEERRQQLKQQYWFDCNCTPCKENWPVFDEMTTDILPFRCLKNRRCPGVVKVSLETEEFSFPCPVCSEQICIFGSLKGLNDTESMFKRGERFIKNQCFQDALDIFLKIMKLLDNTLKSPYKDFCLCQQKIRSSMLAFGNVYQPPSTVKAVKK